MHILGITGTLGAGKGAVVESLKRRGFVHYSAREFILAEVDKRGLTHNRDNTTLVANELRRTHSPHYIIECLYKLAKEKGENAVIESIRAIGELEFLRQQQDFYLIAVDASPRVRYERVVLRNSALDHVSFDKFISDENREMSSVNPTEGSIGDCIQMADFIIRNDSSIEELDKKVGDILKNIMPN